jgi:acyl-coenzyme A synthetase/AMP-(fatty) acid ligase
MPESKIEMSVFKTSNVHIPLLNNIYFGDSFTQNIPTLVLKNESKINALIDLEKYEAFCRNKFKKPIVDLYALFNPFNEAFRAFYPFIAHLKNTLKKGDCILDLSNRTGWTTTFLSAMFPEQVIISMWEGNTDVLGYNGLAYWFANNTENTNIQVVTGKLELPLPFANHTIAMAFGFDVLHRQMRSTLLDELDRICQEEALVFFPHVHLANAEPIPYFKRGGDLLHGSDYESFYRNINKKFNIYSEPELFKKSKNKPDLVTANANTSDYNGLIVISPETIDLDEKIQDFDYFRYFDLLNGQLILNHVMEIDIQNKIQLSKGLLKDEIECLLINHPVYNEIVTEVVDYQVTESEAMIYYWAKLNYSAAEICQIMKMEPAVFIDTIKSLEKLEILQILPLNLEGLRLQNFISTQVWQEPKGKNHLQYMWKKSLSLYANENYITTNIDNNQYSFSDFDQIVRFVTETLVENRLKKGDSVMLHAKVSIETLGIFWACMNLGLVFIPISEDMPPESLKDFVNSFDPSLLFLKNGFPKEVILDRKIIFFESYDIENDPQLTYFSDWLVEEITDIELPEISEDDLAVILFTSGSTGHPKGVQLSHRQLFKSAENMVQAYKWDISDRFLAIGDLDSMSGLRNTCLVTAFTGSVVVVPTYEQTIHMGNLLDCIFENNISILVASPALYYQLYLKKEAKSKLAKIRLALSTGGKLTSQLKTNFFEKTSKYILNYYGLTETAGICIYEPPSIFDFKEGLIGIPINCLIKIVDVDGNRVESLKIGELCIYGSNISNGYWGENTIITDKRGWYHTGDLARIDEKGIVYLEGRNSEFIKNAQSKIINLSEIEQCIRNLSIVKDVGILPLFQNENETYAVFISGINLEENEWATIAIKDTVSNTFGKKMVPIAIYILDSLPRSSNGKLNKQKLTEFLIKNQ